MNVAWSESVGEMWSASPHLSIPDLVLPLLSARPDAIALYFDDGVAVTRGELAAAIADFSAVLRDRVGPGDRVALSMGNRAEFLVAWLAIMSVGAVAVRMNPAAGPVDAAHILRDAGVKLVVADDRTAQRLEGLVGAISSITDLLRTDSTREPFGLAHHGSARTPAEDRHAHPSEIANIHYTSGTTGLPKGCVSTHGGLVRYVDLVARIHPLRSDDCVLSPLQFFYGDSLWLFLLALRADAGYVSMRRFSVSRFWEVVRAYDVTVLLGVGSVPNLLLTGPAGPADRDHRVRLALQVAVPAAQHRELVDRFGFPWIEIYGQSESGITIAMPEQAARSHVGSGAIGIPVPEVEARVVDVQGAVLEAQAAEGELHVRAPFMMKGYLHGASVTAEILDRDGWLRTGDRVRRDDQGVYYFLGRTKEVIRRAGENIAPHEVEAVLRLHESVVDCAVVPVWDPLRGEEVKAYVQVHAHDPAPRPDELTDFCAQRLAPHKVPRFIELRTEDLPRTPSLRVLKSALAVDGVHSTESSWDRETA